jgi:uncharacterized lipoprotein YmbA
MKVPAWVKIATLAALSVAAESGCHSAPTRFYTLHSVSPVGHPLPYTGPPVRIEGVHVPASFDRMEIVTAPAPSELKLNELDHWSAPLARLVQESLTEDLIARLPSDKIISPHIAKSASDLSLSIDILELRFAPGRAHLVASWQFKAEGPTPAPTEFARFEVSQSVSTPAAVVEATSLLLGQLADRISAGLADWSTTSKQRL